MSNGGDFSTERFMVGGVPPERLAQAIPVIEEDPATELAEVKGPSEAPTLLIVNTTPDGAEQLRQQLGPDVVVEPDAPLEMFS